MPDVNELENVLGVVAEKIPEVIRAIRGSFFSAEAGSDLGEAVGNFYKALVDKGIPPEKALELATDYLNTFKGLGQMMNLNK